MFFLESEHLACFLCARVCGVVDFAVGKWMCLRDCVSACLVGIVRTVVCFCFPSCPVGAAASCCCFHHLPQPRGLTPVKICMLLF